MTGGPNTARAAAISQAYQAEADGCLTIFPRSHTENIALHSCHHEVRHKAIGDALLLGHVAVHQSSHFDVLQDAIRTQQPEDAADKERC